MGPRESTYPADWFRIAHKDFDRANRLLEDFDVEGTAFNLQQAAEKCLKGFLLSKGWKLRRIHDLELLLNEAVAFDASLESYRLLSQNLTEYYMEERYPGTLASNVTDAELREVAKKVGDLMKHLIG